MYLIQKLMVKYSKIKLRKYIPFFYKFIKPLLYKPNKYCLFQSKTYFNFYKIEIYLKFPAE